MGLTHPRTGFSSTLPFSIRVVRTVFCSASLVGTTPLIKARSGPAFQLLRKLQSRERHLQHPRYRDLFTTKFAVPKASFMSLPNLRVTPDPMSPVLEVPRS
ncbi:hypothetical protein UY3_00409 [Chelonia mydas]|uniref:Uncharacterized protein n=1 Tax=Chelonia mydas TaxID=8469 RepID=M7C2F3_CHEMY|nr:hypothetical protein UY3_00409 [Chelonia mydas]